MLILLLVVVMLWGISARDNFEERAFGSEVWVMDKWSKGVGEEALV